MDTRRRALLGALAGSLVAQRLMAQDAHAQAALTRPIPSSGERLPLIGLGTWQTFDVGNDAAARSALGEVLELLAASNGALLDSSPMYGSSEAVAGELIAGRGLRARLFIATKVWTRGRAEGIRQMEDSLRKLRVERLDLMQVHNLLDAAVHTRTLQDWKARGRVRHIGITHYTASAHAELGRLLETRQYDFVQVNYSLAEREADERLLRKAADLQVAVIVNRPFGEGALFRKVRGKALPPWAAELGVRSWAQYFLKWIVSHPAVTCAIPATSRPAHMRDNLAAGTGPLPDAAARKRMLEYFESI